MRPLGALETLEARVARHLAVLCREVEGRLVGTEGNRAATHAVSER
jgi:hypothetical protein